MKLLFRVDSSRQIGGGHVMRCLTLAHAALERGHQVIFLCRDLDGNMNQIIAQQVPLEILPAPATPFQSETGDPSHAFWAGVSWREDAEQTRQICMSEKPDWLILDHYGFDARWSQRVAPNRLFVIDDLADRALDADILLDQTRLQPEPYPASVRCVLRGPNYTLLREEFANAQPRTRPSGKPRILIAPGLMDSYDLAALALEAIKELDIDIDLATSNAAPAIARLQSNTPPNLTLHTPAKDMADLINQATLAIAAGGMSAWERCALALPSVIISVAENQQHVCDGLSQEGASLHLPGTPRPTAEDLRRACLDLLNNPKALQEMSQAANKLCDGNGTKRVLDILEANLRVLHPNDKGQVFNWRNQPHIRSVSHRKDPLDPQEHANWFEKALKSESAFHRIYQEGQIDLGFVSARQTEHGWFWSFYIGSQDAPKGAGRRMLVSFLDLFFDQSDAPELKATVLPQNPISLHLHRSLGFTQDPQIDTSDLTFTLSRLDWERSKHHDLA